MRFLCRNNKITMYIIVMQLAVLQMIDDFDDVQGRKSSLIQSSSRPETDRTWRGNLVGFQIKEIVFGFNNVRFLYVA